MRSAAVTSRIRSPGDLSPKPRISPQTNRFLAPMDQTHTLTGGLSRTAILEPACGWASAIEFGSGTPMGHGGAGSRARARERQTTRTFCRPADHRACPGISRRMYPPASISCATPDGARRLAAAGRSREHDKQCLPDRAGGRVLSRAVFHSSPAVRYGEGAFLTVWVYSSRKATTGSTRVARRAGM